MRSFGAKNEKTYVCTAARSQGNGQYSMQCTEVAQGEPIIKHQVQGRRCDSDSDCDGIQFKGKHYRGYGPDLLPGPGSQCPMYDEDGCEVGIQKTTAENPGTPSAKFVYDFQFHDGSTLYFKNIPGITKFTGITQDVVNSYPELAPYLNNPNYAFVMFNSRSIKNQLPYTSDWAATGKQTKVNKVEFRCQYFGSVPNPANPLALNNFNGIECIGCHWFVGRE